MIVVTNAGPLMALAKLGLLHLLGQLYGKVEMSTAVYNEVVLRGMEQRIIEKKWYGSLLEQYAGFLSWFKRKFEGRYWHCLANEVKEFRDKN